MPNIIVIMPFDASSREKLKSAAIGCNITYAFDADIPYTEKQDFDLEKYGDALRTCDICIGQPPVEILGEMKNLKLLNLAMAGTEPFSRMMPKDALLTNSSGAYGQAISEHMLASVLMLYKKLHLYRDNMRNGEWTDCGEVQSIYGKTVLCVGLGDIGCAFARLCKLMGAHIIGVRRRGMDMPDYVDELYHAESLDSILCRGDITAISLPNTPQTSGLFSAERIGKMKNGALLLNVGRGNAVDTNALADALDSGKLGGASIDVTDPEPLPSSHRLWKCSNLLITPHISGFFHLRATYDRIVDYAVENVTHFLNGEPLINMVDLSTGYRITQKYTKI